jgi:hypothetical protein
MEFFYEFRGGKRGLMSKSRKGNDQDGINAYVVAIDTITDAP